MEGWREREAYSPHFSSSTVFFILPPPQDVRLRISRSMAGKAKPAQQRLAIAASVKSAWAARKREEAAAVVAATSARGLDQGSARPPTAAAAAAAAFAEAALAATLPTPPALAPTTSPYEPRAGVDDAAAAESVEAALAELSTLRRLVGTWVQAFVAANGRSPSREDARAAAPATYAAFTRFVALRDYVRSADARG